MSNKGSNNVKLIQLNTKQPLNKILLAYKISRYVIKSLPLSDINFIRAGIFAMFTDLSPVPRIMPSIPKANIE